MLFTQSTNHSKLLTLAFCNILQCFQGITCHMFEASPRRRQPLCTCESQQYMTACQAYTMYIIRTCRTRRRHSMPALFAFKYSSISKFKVQKGGLQSPAQSAQTTQRHTTDDSCPIFVLTLKFYALRIVHEGLNLNILQICLSLWTMNPEICSKS